MSEITQIFLFTSFQCIKKGNFFVVMGLLFLSCASISEFIFPFYMWYLITSFIQWRRGPRMMASAVSLMGTLITPKYILGESSFTVGDCILM